MNMKMKRVLRTQKIIFLCLFIFTCTSMFLLQASFFTQEKEEMAPIDFEFRSKFQLAKILSEQRIKSSMNDNKEVGCVMPKLPVMSDELAKFIIKMDDVVCNYTTDWVKCYKSECTLSDYGLKLKNVVCIYREIFLIDDIFPLGDRVEISGSDVFTFKQNDYVSVSCQADSQILLKVPIRWVGYKAGLRHVFRKIWKAGDAPNIMILALDSTSLNGFIRKLPEVYDYIVKELGAFVFDSYNIVGDGTSGALFPIFAGKYDYDFEYAARGSINSTRLDPKDFLFHTMNELGYETLFFEDMPWIGTFQRKYTGFSSVPTDRYNRAFIMVESSKGEKWWQSIKKRHCVGDTPHHTLTLNLTSQFLETKNKHFGFTILADVCHEEFNLISTLREDLLKFLVDYKNNKMQDTFLIVMGDHGSRYTAGASYRKTTQGRLEERLPLLTIIPSLNFHKQRPEAIKNLKKNQNILTTPFDLHATLLDLVGLKSKANPYKVPGSNYPRSISLLDPIPITRSCPEAGIEPHFCACVKWRQLSKDEMEEYLFLVIELIQKINEMTASYRLMCAKLRLGFINKINKLIPNDEVVKYIKCEDGSFKNSTSSTSVDYYEVQVILEPGSAIFEATFQLGSEVKARDISRLDRYGNSSQCIAKLAPKLEKFCYCTQSNLKETVW